MKDMEFVCMLLQANYEKQMKEINPSYTDDDLFPNYWYDNDDFEQKARFLKEAIEKRITLENVPGISILSEGVIKLGK